MSIGQIAETHDIGRPATTRRSADMPPWAGASDASLPRLHHCAGAGAVHKRADRGIIPALESAHRPRLAPTHGPRDPSARIDRRRDLSGGGGDKAVHKINT